MDEDITDTNNDVIGTCGASVVTYACEDHGVDHVAHSVNVTDGTFYGTCSITGVAYKCLCLPTYIAIQGAIHSLVSVGIGVGGAGATGLGNPPDPDLGKPIEPTPFHAASMHDLHPPD